MYFIFLIMPLASPTLGYQFQDTLKAKPFVKRIQSSEVSISGLFRSEGKISSPFSGGLFRRVLVHQCVSVLVHQCVSVLVVYFYVLINYIKNITSARPSHPPTH